MRLVKFALILVLFAASCSKIKDVVAYETSIERVSIRSDVIPTYPKVPLPAPDLIKTLSDDGFTSFISLDRGGLRREWYGKNRDYTDTANIKSISKSLFSLLVGRLENEGAIKLDVPISSVNECAVPPKIQPLTPTDLLNMSVGFEIVENVTTSIYAKPNWPCNILKLPIDFETGAKLNYATPQFHLLGVHVEQRTGKAVASLLEQDILNPMGVHLDGWVVTPDGHSFTGSELRLHPRDLARIGQVILEGGRWNGDQIIPEKWLSKITKPYFQKTGRAGISYGFGWWHTKLAGQDILFAEGYGGQALVLAPTLERGYVFTAPAGGHVTGKTHDRRITTLLEIVEVDLSK